jgi:hypothetical protein
VTDSRGASLASAVLLTALNAGCAHGAGPSKLPATVPRSSDGSSVCEGLIGRFIGLPAVEEVPQASLAPAALAGRWWVRKCAAPSHEGRVHLRLEGPGWYFVDEDGSDLSLHQQVSFDLGVELEGRLDADLESGVLSIWLVPEKEPLIELDVSRDLDVRASSAWGAVLRWMPLVPVQAMAADRFSDAAVSALRIKLRSGATATYDFRSRQGDATLGKLGAGQTPNHAFGDRTPWLVNERLRLAPSSVHVLGPIAPGPTRLDVNVEQGEGIAYRAVCERDLDSNYSALARGRVGELSVGAIVTRGKVTGLGLHTTDFAVTECKFYLIISSLAGARRTLVSLRVRA